MQNSQDSVVRVVCFSPEKRTLLKEKQTQQIPVKLDDINKTPSKRKLGEDDYTVRKKCKISPTTVDFTYNRAFDDNNMTIDEILQNAILYDNVDIKVKMLTKPEEKTTLIINGKRKMKVDCLVADQTNNIKLTLWENTIDMCQAAKCYQFENLKVNVFDDQKFLNSTEQTKVTQIDEIQNVNLDSPQIKDSLITGNIVSVYIKKYYSCLVCNHNFNTDLNPDDEVVTCSKCHMTTLASLLNTKLICHLGFHTNGKLVNYTGFNSAIESFLSMRGQTANLSDIDCDALKKDLLKSGPQQVLIDQSSKVIAQFLPLNK